MNRTPYDNSGEVFFIVSKIKRREVNVQNVMIRIITNLILSDVHANHR